MTATTSLTIAGASGGDLSARHTVAQSASLTGRIMPPSNNVPAADHGIDIRGGRMR